LADEAVNRLGVMLEELGARFELVIEAVSGFGGRLDSLRAEMFAQFAEVGGQMRFLSEQIAENRVQIAENRRAIVATHDDLGAEIIRLAEALGKARVEFREELGAAQVGLRGEIAESAKSIRDELGAVRAELRAEITDSAKSIRGELGAVQTGLRGEIAESTKSLKREIAASAELAARKLGAELRQTNKALANLTRKFDRFDDRITIQTRDQDQRLRKVERKRGA
jgi:hypothetical protein